MRLAIYLPMAQYDIAPRSEEGSWVGWQPETSGPQNPELHPTIPLWEMGVSAASCTQREQQHQGLQSCSWYLLRLFSLQGIAQHCVGPRGIGSRSRWQSSAGDMWLHTPVHMWVGSLRHPGLRQCSRLNPAVTKPSEVISDTTYPMDIRLPGRRPAGALAGAVTH